MGSRFLVSFTIAFALTVSVLGGIGWAVAQFVVATPREQFFTSYFQFDLAPGWSCDLDGTEYVCNPPGGIPRPAIVIMAMKERNEQDRLEAYEEHLRQSQPFKHADGSTTMSEVRFVRRTKLGGKEWVEGLHIGSEVPNYHTYYLATTTSYLGILVTMSVHKGQTDGFVGQLTEMMATLVVYQR
jgi:hypothetical protein